VQIFQLITETSTAFEGNYTQYIRRSTDWNIIDIANAYACTTWVVDVKYLIVIWYCCETAKPRALCESINGPVQQSTNNPIALAWLRHFPWTVLELTVNMNWQPLLPMWKQFCSDLNSDLRYSPETFLILVVVVFIIGKITVPKRHLRFRIFQPSATQYLYCPPDEILFASEHYHFIDVFLSSCSRAYLLYCTKLRAMLQELMEGLYHVFMESCCALSSPDNWEHLGVLLYFLNNLLGGIQRCFMDSKNGFCSGRHIV